MKLRKVRFCIELVASEDNELDRLLMEKVKAILESGWTIGKNIVPFPKKDKETRIQENFTGTRIFPTGESNLFIDITKLSEE